jgi:transposase
MIRVDVVWLAVAPIDMRAGFDTALARVVAVFGCAQAHHAYVFSNRRGNRLKVLVHDGLGIWLCARRLHQGRFVWPKDHSAPQMTLTRAQFDALVIGLPWVRIGMHSAIALV